MTTGLLALSVDMIRIQIGSDLGLCTIPIGEKLLFVVEKFLSGFGSEFLVLSFDDRVHGACLLTEPTVNTFRHVNIVFGSSSRAVHTSLTLNGNSLSWAYGLTQLASNAPFFAAGVSPERMLATESGRKRAFLERVHDGVRFPEELFQDDPHASNDFGEEEQMYGLVNSAGPALVWVNLIALCVKEVGVLVLLAVNLGLEVTHEGIVVVNGLSAGWSGRRN